LIPREPISNPQSTRHVGPGLYREYPFHSTWLAKPTAARETFKLIGCIVADRLDVGVGEYVE